MVIILFNCFLKNVVQFHIQSTAFRLDEVFERMEQIKNRFVDYIEDYSVQQTTLEEVQFIYLKSIIA